jgi:hypothetical protein
MATSYVDAKLAIQSGMETTSDGTTNDNRIMKVVGDQKQENV